MADRDPAPRLQILAQEPELLSLWTVPPSSNDQPCIEVATGPCKSIHFSEDGSKLMVMKADSTICIYDCSNFAVIRSFQIHNVLAATLSPRGNYLQTFQKSSTPQEKNLLLWKIETESIVYQQFQKNMSKTTWPSIQFSYDEAIACRLATNEIQFFDTGDFSKEIPYFLKIPGIAAIELSKAPGSYVAAFVAESEGIPARIQIFACGKAVQAKKKPQAHPVIERMLFLCTTVQLRWNYGSTGLLAVAQWAVDNSNWSCYGEPKLHYLTTDGAHARLVPIGGPVHDARWSCTGSEFAVVYGRILSSAARQE